MKLYKRVKLSNNNQILVLEIMGNLDYILKTNKDFCEQQLKNLEDVESAMFNTQSCKFSEIENNCITAKLDKKIQKREALKVKISHLEESIKELNETKDFTNNVDERIRFTNLFRKSK